MTIKTKETGLNISLSDLDLPFAASSIMKGQAPVIKLEGSLLSVCYLATDNDPANPIKKSDGLGRIYSTLNDLNDLSTHKKVREALGLNDDWEPNLDLVTAEDLREPWINTAAQTKEYQEFVRYTEWVYEGAVPEDELSEGRYKSHAEYLWRESHGDDGEVISNNLLISTPYSFGFTHELRLGIWNSLRIKGRIGTENAVLLDCYEDVDGTGYGPEFLLLSNYDVVCCSNTSSNGYPGVWIPDEHVEYEIKRRSSLYVFGQICEGDNGYHVALDEQYGGLKSPEFSEWGKAFKWLKNKAAKLSLPNSKTEQDKLLSTAKRRASRELAKEALVIYNDWASGNAYGLVCAFYSNTGTEESPIWSFEYSNENWGYYRSHSTVEESIKSLNSLATLFL